MKTYYLAFVDKQGKLHYRKGPFTIEDAFRAKEGCWKQENFKVVEEIKQVKVIG